VLALKETECSNWRFISDVSELFAAAALPTKFIFVSLYVLDEVNTIERICVEFIAFIQHSVHFVMCLDSLHISYMIMIALI